MNLFCFFLPTRKKENPTHKTAHLQITQANARPKFAKELFSLRSLVHVEKSVEKIES